MRADRLLSILLLLQMHERITARELAARLEVSERTILRDMEALGAAGVPVVAERGLGGGWALLEEYRTNLNGLNEAEVRALFLAQRTHLLDALGMGAASESAAIKLLSALPGLSRRDAEYARRCIHVDGAGWYGHSECVPLLPVLHDAIWQQRRLHLVYERGDGTTVERLVEPLGLVVKGSIWYLVANVEGDMRNYRVSRMREARLSDEQYERPADFDLAAFWERSAADFKRNLPRYPATVRIDAAQLGRLRQMRFSQVEHVGPVEQDGWVTVEVLFEVEDDACSQVLSFGASIEVLAPPELRELVVREAEAMLARYALAVQQR